MKTNWPESNDTVLAAANELHVWAVPLDDVRTPWDELYATLSSEEHERAARFLRDEPRHAFVVARAALRQILGRYLDAAAADVVITNDPLGKPRLAEERAAGDLKFNLAHSGKLSVVAVARGGEIGVDVELLRPVEHWQEISTRYFHAREAAAIGNVPAANPPAAFMQCWTRKEAVLKLVGVGINYPLREFYVPMGDGAEGCVDVPPHSSVAATRCWIQPLEPCAGYVAAVATVEQKSPARGRTWPI